MKTKIINKDKLLRLTDLMGIICIAKGFTDTELNGDVIILNDEDEKLAKSFKELGLAINKFEQETGLKFK